MFVVAVIAVTVVFKFLCFPMGSLIVTFSNENIADEVIKGV